MGWLLKHGAPPDHKKKKIIITLWACIPRAKCMCSLIPLFTNKVGLGQWTQLLGAPHAHLSLGSSLLECVGILECYSSDLRSRDSEFKWFSVMLFCKSKNEAAWTLMLTSWNLIFWQFRCCLQIGLTSCFFFFFHFRNSAFWECRAAEECEKWERDPECGEPQEWPPLLCLLGCTARMKNFNTSSLVHLLWSSK